MNLSEEELIALIEERAHKVVQTEVSKWATKQYFPDLVFEPGQVAMFNDTHHRLMPSDTAGGGGHIFQDNGTSMTERTYADFQDGFVLTDDSAGDATEIDLDYATTEIADIAEAESAGTSSKVPRADHVHSGQAYVLEASANYVDLTDGGATVLHSHAGDAHALLDGSIHTDTLADAVTRGSLIYGNSTPKWDELNLGAWDGMYLRSDATDAGWSSITPDDVAGVGPFLGWGRLETSAVGITVDTKAVCGPWALRTDCTIKSVWIGCWRSSGSPTAKAVIYNDSAGAPNALIGTSDEVTLTNGSIAWIEFPFTSKPNLTAGTSYHIGMIAGGSNISAGSSTVAGVYNGLGVTYVFNSDTYVGGASDPFGAPSTSARVLAAYAEIEMAGGGAAHALLDGGTAHSDSAADTVSRGSLIYGNATPAWDELVIGASGAVLRSDGTDAAWTVPNQYRIHKFRPTAAPNSALVAATDQDYSWTGDSLETVIRVLWMFKTLPSGTGHTLTFSLKHSAGTEDYDTASFATTVVSSAVGTTTENGGTITSFTDSTIDANSLIQFNIDSLNNGSAGDYRDMWVFMLTKAGLTTA